MLLRLLFILTLPLYTIRASQNLVEHISSRTQLPTAIINQHLKDIRFEQFGYYKFMPNLINQRKLKVGVELGVLTGGHSNAILKNSTIEKLYSIDPYSINRASAFAHKDNNFQDIFHAWVEWHLSKHGTRSELMRAYSYEVAHLFEDHSLDFVFIDADHNYDSVKQDLEMWFDKVKPGGIVCGDDYDTGWPGVARAVHEFFHAKNLKVNIVYDVSTYLEGKPRIWWVEK